MLMSLLIMKYKIFILIISDDYNVINNDKWKNQVPLGCASLMSDRPVVLNDDEVVIKQSEQLILTCKGSKPLYWSSYINGFNVGIISFSLF